MVNDIVSDTLTRIQNATDRKKTVVTVLSNKVVLALLEVLESEGFIESHVKDGDTIEVTLSTAEDAPTVFKRVSKPGQRIYVKSRELVPIMNGRGVGVLSTSAGIMTTAKAKSSGLGGEYLCKVW